MYFVLAVLVVCACGRLDFDSSDETLSITDPGDQDEVDATVTLTGTCRSHFTVELTGDITPVALLCENGAFVATVAFTAGDGPKLVTASQPGELVSRTFARVTPIKLRGTSAGFVVSAGFMVDCELTVAVPAGLQPGDVMIGAVYTDGGATGGITAPGFTATAMTAPTYRAFYKVATAAEPAAYTISITAGTGQSDTCESAAVLVSFSGVATPPILAESGQVDSNDTMVVAPGLVAPKRGVLVGVWGSNGPVSGFTVSGMTVADEAYSNGDFASVVIAYTGVQAGPTGDRKADLQLVRAAAAGLFLLDGKP